MFARITKYKVRADAIDDARETLNGLRGEIMALPGMVHFVNCLSESGNGYIIAVVESRAAAEGSREKVRALWASFGEYLEGVPEPKTFEVIADWANENVLA